MSDTNEYEERNRAAKAYRLVRYCEDNGWDDLDVQDFHPIVWEQMALCAKVKPPSDRTKAIVLHILRDRANG